MKKFNISFIILLLLGCSPNKESNSLPYYGDANFSPNWFSEDSIPDNFHKIAPFSFTNQYGETVSQESLNGKLKIVTFFFCSCPGICPTIMDNLKKANNKFPDIPILSHSVTPRKDSISVLLDYAKARGIKSKNWHLLTGDKQEIYTLARKSYFTDTKPNPDIDNDFLHSENVYLIDENNYIRGIYKGSFPIEINHLIEDIKILTKK